MPTTAPPAENASWWVQRRWAFSLSLIIIYAGALVTPEMWTPHWSGDRIRLSLGAIAFFVVGGLLWTGVANVLYGLGQFGERFVSTESVPTYRTCAHLALRVGGVVSTLFWFARWMLEAWSKRR